METNHIFIKDNASSRKKLWDSQQKTISDNESLSQIKAISLECYWKVQSLDLPQKSQVFLGKTNTRADILSRKDQVDMMEDNKNIKMLKDKLWKRRMSIEAEVAILRGNQMVEETTLSKEISKNSTK